MPERDLSIEDGCGCDECSLEREALQIGRVLVDREKSLKGICIDICGLTEEEFNKSFYGDEA